MVCFFSQKVVAKKKEGITCGSAPCGLFYYWFVCCCCCCWLRSTTTKVGNAKNIFVFFQSEYPSTESSTSTNEQTKWVPFSLASSCIAHPKRFRNPKMITQEMAHYEPGDLPHAMKIVNG